MTQDDKSKLQAWIWERIPTGFARYSQDDMIEAVEFAYNLACDRCAETAHCQHDTDEEEIAIVDKSSILKNKIL